MLGQELPADTLAADRRPGRGGPAAHRARRQGPGVGPGRGGRRAGGRLARPAAARQPARLRAAGRRAGRPGRGAGAGATLVGQTSALLDEERRLFYVAATRARRRLLVTRGRLGRGRRRRRRGAAEPLPARAGARAGSPGRAGRRARPAEPAGEPGPARVAPMAARGDGGVAATVAGREPGRRGAAADPAAPGAHPAGARGRAAYRRHRPGRPRPPAARRGRRAGPARRRRGARRAPGRLVGAARRSPTTGRWSTRASRSGSPRPPWRARCGAACAGCWNGTAAAARPAPRRASATWCTPPRCSPRTPAPTGRALLEYVAARFDAIELAARWLAGPEQDRAEAMVDKLLRWLADNPRRLLAIEHEFTVRLDDPSRPIDLTGRVDRLEVDDAGPAGGHRPEDRQDHRRHRRPSWPSTRSSAATRWRSRRARSTSSATSPAAPRWCSSAPAPRRPGSRRRRAVARPPTPAGRRRWCAAPPRRWPPPPSPRWPTPSAGSARCGPAARSPARAARSSSRRPGPEPA